MHGYDIYGYVSRFQYPFYSAAFSSSPTWPIIVSCSLNSPVKHSQELSMVRCTTGTATSSISYSCVISNWISLIQPLNRRRYSFNPAFKCAISKKRRSLYYLIWTVGSRRACDVHISQSALSLTGVVNYVRTVPIYTDGGISRNQSEMPTMCEDIYHGDRWNPDDVRGREKQERASVPMGMMMTAVRTW